MNAGNDLDTKASQIGHRLKSARKRAKLRQEDVAARLKVHPVTVSRWENGEGTDRMQGPAMRQLAALYGTTVEALFEGSAEASRTTGELNMNVSRGTSPAARPVTSDPLRALRIVQNDVERQLIELGVSEETLAYAGQLFADLSRAVRSLVAGEPRPMTAEQHAAATGTTVGDKGKTVTEWTKQQEADKKKATGKGGRKQA